MVRAYVLIKGAAGKISETLERLEKISEVKSVECVTGIYEFIAIVEADDVDKISDIVINKIKTTEGVIETNTCIVLTLK